jgi:glutamate N-acetyltransferase/amino-acid N-acetyltransferase
MANITKVSPLAPKGGLPQLPAITGVRFSAAAAGVKYEGRDDVMLAEIAAGSSVAGVFTRSSTRSANVLDCQRKLGHTVDANNGFAFVVNSGNSNAFTGRAGDASVSRICEGTGKILKIPTDHVFTSSTGVIGERLPDNRITAVLDDLAKSLDPNAMSQAAHAIMTTDTFAKGTSVTVGGVTIAGIAKGSGMIAPDMATMLVYIFTDAKIAQPDLQKLVSGINEKTFNCITVDSDTSTSDTLLMAATGASDIDVTGDEAFEQALHGLMKDLAHQVVRDGEGATKFVEVAVTGARNDADARKVALSIANSPLIKTAIAGEDPNWGRVVMAVGKSGAEADRDTLSISFGDIKVAENGWVAEDYKEDDGADYMKAQDLVICADLGLADGTATVWTCDLTHGYIEINADYRS